MRVVTHVACPVSVTHYRESSNKRPRECAVSSPHYMILSTEQLRALAAIVVRLHGSPGVCIYTLTIQACKDGYMIRVLTNDDPMHDVYTGHQ